MCPYAFMSIPKYLSVCKLRSALSFSHMLVCWCQSQGDCVCMCSGQQSILSCLFAHVKAKGPACKHAFSGQKSEGSWCVCALVDSREPHVCVLSGQKIIGSWRVPVSKITSICTRTILMKSGTQTRKKKTHIAKHRCGNGSSAKRNDFGSGEFSPAKTLLEKWQIVTAMSSPQ